VEAAAAEARQRSPALILGVAAADAAKMRAI